MVAVVPTTRIIEFPDRHHHTGHHLYNSNSNNNNNRDRTWDGEEPPWEVELTLVLKDLIQAPWTN
jgi:hypothetical protein